MTKREARTFYLSERMALSDGIRQHLSAQLLEQFKKIVFAPLRCIHVYQPILSKREIDTHPFVSHLQALFPGLTLVVPRVSGATSLDHILWEAGTFLSTSPWGIPEPLEGVRVEPGQIDLVLVPLVIFDQGGTRVGYGKGLYDRLLASCRPDVLKIGLSFFDPVAPFEDSAEFDVPLSIGITPTQLYEFV
jgi:5-formyltetrahydrofolate cyclo-ligase